MKSNVADYDDYKVYLADFLKSLGPRGSQAKLATALGCGTSFVSQVLKGRVHFSLEQAVRINRFVGHDAEASHFFMLLIQYARAGSKDLADYFFSQTLAIRDRRKNIKDRLQIRDSLSSEDQIIYYSSWIFAACHISLSIPKYRTKAKIADALGLPLELVSETLDFLEKRGLAKGSDNIFRIGTKRIHLEKNSPMISKHHTNWRLKALESLERRTLGGTHFSSLMGIAERDAEKIRSIVLEAISRTENVVQDSKEQRLFCLGIDFFPLTEL